jgi:SAM-dependent methyltransferase
VDPGFLALLRCPSCDRDQMTGAAGRVECAGCGSEFPTAGGFIDLLDVQRRGTPTPSTAEQRLMESELVARIYERFWRPTFVRVIAGSGAGAVTGGFPGELFIHKNALAMEDRAGPWLDLSCGPGLFARAMAAAAPSSLVIGLDISRAMLEAAAHRSKGYANVALIRADAHSLPLVDGCLGGVNNAGALHAYDDPDHVFREILRVLSPGGVYVGSTFSQSTSLMGRLSARVAGIRRFDPLELRAHLSRLGFCEYDEIRLGDAFIFRVRKP